MEVDALFLAVVSVSTVGYGNVPMSDKLRMLFVPLLLLTVFVFAVALRDLAAVPIELRRQRLEVTHPRSCHTHREI